MKLRGLIPLLTCMAFVPVLATTDEKPALAASGSFGFCQSASQENCIEQVVVTRVDGATSTYSSSSALSADNVQADIGCTAMGGTCDGVVTSTQVTEAAKTCSPITTDMSMRSLTVSGGVIGHRDWTVQLDARTGTFEPAFSLGNGIVDTRISPDSDGTWKYSITLKPVVQALVTYPAELQLVGPMPSDYTQKVNAFLATAEATMVHAKAGASIWPPSYLYWSGSPTTGCAYLPLTGMWGTTNGNGFEFGLRKKENAGTGLQYEFVFKVSSAHYVKKDMLDVEVGRFGTYNSGPFSGERILNPADVRMMLPKAYISALGYAQAGDIPSSALTVTTEDGQTASPKISPRSDGSAILDFGISHFSAPNPAVSVQQNSTVSSSTAVTRSLGRNKSISAAKVVNATVKGSKTWTATGRCKVSGSRIVASASTGSCKVTVTVRNTKKKVLFRKTATLNVT